MRNASDQYFSSITLHQLHHGGHLNRSALGASLNQKFMHFGVAQNLIRSTNVNQDLVERINLELEALWCFSRKAPK
jgi:hypothetical protein